MQFNDIEMQMLNKPSTRRRSMAACLGGLGMFGLMGKLAAAPAARSKPHKSLIILWLKGGPSQLETFDPHPNSPISYGTTGIPTSIPGIQVASGLAQTAELMHEVTLIRSMKTKEGDHQRAVYNMKTGYRPNPSVVHPSIGAILCHELPDSRLEIPSHISILASEQGVARGGFLGARFDAFRVGDPQKPLPLMRARVGQRRIERRLESLSVVEQAFAREHPQSQQATLHGETVGRARRMMSSEQLAAFDITMEPNSVRSRYGETAFGRGCLAARRLVEAGVRCVEVTLGGWDSHFNNHEAHAKALRILDPAFANLIADLKERDRLDSTLVLCAGEFGRTPKLNTLTNGRDHWPHGFSVALAGAGFRSGHVVGATDPNGEKADPERPIHVQDLHATILKALGLDPEFELITPANRPIALSDGRIIRELLRS